MPRMPPLEIHPEIGRDAPVPPETIIPTAKLDRDLVARIVDAFPFGDGWQQRESRSFVHPTRPGFRQWHHIDDLWEVGGIYAFLLPATLFAEPRVIHLHAAGGTKILFEFTAPAICPEGLAVLYVGRTSNLRNRFEMHHTVGDRLGSAQVKYGLMDCGVCADQKQAITFIHDHARIVWHPLPGPQNAANRDLAELSLCAKWAPPFNTKAER
jgi:hypothetical protein